MFMPDAGEKNALCIPFLEPGRPLKAWPQPAGLCVLYMSFLIVRLMGIGDQAFKVGFAPGQAGPVWPRPDIADIRATISFVLNHIGQPDILPTSPSMIFMPTAMLLALWL